MPGYEDQQDAVPRERSEAEVEQIAKLKSQLNELSRQADEKRLEGIISAPTKAEASASYREGFLDGQHVAKLDYDRRNDPMSIDYAPGMVAIAAGRAKYDYGVTPTSPSTAPLTALALEVCNVLDDVHENLTRLYHAEGTKNTGERLIHPAGLRALLESAIAQGESLRDRVIRVVAEVEQL